MSARKLYLWRAWSKDRERICDCGIANATDEDDAKQIASMCVGGPHWDQVWEIQVEPVRGDAPTISLRLTDDEYEALRWARLCVLDDRQRSDRTIDEERAWGTKWDAALAVLSKIIEPYLERKP